MRIFEFRMKLNSLLESLAGLIKVPALAVNLADFVPSVGILMVEGNLLLKCFQCFLGDLLIFQRVQEGSSETEVRRRKPRIPPNCQAVFVGGEIIKHPGLEGLSEGDMCPRRVWCNIGKPDHGLQGPITVQMRGVIKSFRIIWITTEHFFRYLDGLGWLP